MGQIVTSRLPCLLIFVEPITNRYCNLNHIKSYTLIGICKFKIYINFMVLFSYSIGTNLHFECFYWFLSARTITLNFVRISSLTRLFKKIFILFLISIILLLIITRKLIFSNSVFFLHRHIFLSASNSSFLTLEISFWILFQFPSFIW